MVKAKDNAHGFDTRHSLEVKFPALRRIIDETQTRPLVSSAELNELGPIFEGLPPLRFPITSAGHFLDQLCDHDMVVNGVKVDPARMIKYMPSHYFPVWTYDNLIEKMAELARAP